jgi:hypothetical protein
MSDVDVLPDDEVCACLNDTGERKVRLYERCQRCGVFMAADDVAEHLAAAEARVQELEAALREYCSHQTWRCEYPDRYPWEPDCMCGLLSTLEKVGLKDWADEYRSAAALAVEEETP